MRVTYLGPMLLGTDHPVLEGVDVRRFPSSCFLVEVSDGSGVSGPLMEGDVLVVDEARTIGHADLVVAEVEQEYRLFHSHRIGGRFRLLPTAGGQGHFANVQHCRGVVIRQTRMYAA